MKRNIVVLLSLLASFLITNIAFAGNVQDGELLPDIILMVPDNKSHAQYLGITGETGTPFSIRQIDADILIIELFSMYCPQCQKAAPKVNELYGMMQRLQKEDLKIKIIGIGAKNTQLEVNTFRETYDIPFPLFPDTDLSIYKTLAGKGTPTFIGCEKIGDNKYIFIRKSGGFRDPEIFLNYVLKNSQVAK